jgi:hypothetical protein
MVVGGVELICHGELRTPLHTQRGHVKPDRRLSCLIRVKIHYYQDGVTTWFTL